MKRKSPTKKLTIPDCNDNDTNEIIADSHSISKTTHDTMIAGFFGATNAPSANLPLDDSSINYSKDCLIYGVKIALNPANRTDNSDIKVSMCLFSDLQKPHTDHFIMHSLHFMKGLRDRKQVKSLHLSKAFRIEDGQNVPTVALKGINDKGVAVYWGDLSSMIPFIGSEK